MSQGKDDKGGSYNLILGLCSLSTPFLFLLTQGVLNEKYLITSTKYSILISVAFVLYEAINVLCLIRLKKKPASFQLCITIINIVLVFLIYGIAV
jgi:hypothetical protein